jgi:hypothetical protein
METFKTQKGVNESPQRQKSRRIFRLKSLYSVTKTLISLKI